MPLDPGWTNGAKLTARGRDLLSNLRTADRDGLNPADYMPRGDAGDQALSAGLVKFANDLVRAPGGLHYVADALPPKGPCAADVLAAAADGALDSYLQQLREPNGAAVALRRALDDAPAAEKPGLAHDLALARSIGPAPRAVLVDSTTAQLWEVTSHGIAGHMRVVVGKPGNETPQMVARLQWADVNPYWYVPDDIVRASLAPKIVSSGPNFFTQHLYEAVDSYDDDDAHVLDPAAVNWRAVEAGKSDIGLRQLPGPTNMLGRVAFVLPNQFGIYLHDTPARWVFSASDRHLSHGCVRLEDAAGLFQFLFGRSLPAPDAQNPDDEYDVPGKPPLLIAALSAAGAAALDASA